MAASSSYSSLFTAGLFALPASTTSSSRVDTAGPSKSSVPAAITTMPSISIRAPPASPTRKTDPSPRRRRKSSATIGSSPMAAIKSPAQRAQFAQRSAHRSYTIAVTSPSRALVFPSNGIHTVPENRTLVRARRGRPPPVQKPAPSAPLPDLPPLPFTQSNKNRDPTLRRDSDTLPLPSPTMLSFAHRPTTYQSQSSGQSSLLAPSPVLYTPKIVNDTKSSPLLGAVDEKEEANDMTLDE